jgi:hypothetical protein
MKSCDMDDLLWTFRLLRHFNVAEIFFFKCIFKYFSHFCDVFPELNANTDNIKMEAADFI